MGITAVTGGRDVLVLYTMGFVPFQLKEGKVDRKVQYRGTKGGVGVFLVIS